MAYSEKNKRNHFNPETEAIKVLRVAAFCFSIISWLATAEGLANYVFDNDWRVYMISFAIQSILFIFNLQLPQYFHELKNKKILFVLVYAVVLVSSSVFSFVYICTNAVYMHNVGYTDADIVLSNGYTEILTQTDNYISESKKATLLIASKQLSELELPRSEESMSLEELQDLESEAKEQYDNAVAELKYLESQLEAVQKNKDNYSVGIFYYEAEYKEAQEEYERILGEKKDAEKIVNQKQTEYKNAKRNVINYQPSQDIIKQEFLTELLSGEIDEGNLKKHMATLTEMILVLGESDKTVSTFGELVETTQSLSMTIDQYESLLKIDNNRDESSEVTVLPPDPESDSFESDLKQWRDEWKNKYNILENTINVLPSFSSENITYLKNESINTDLLNEYDTTKLTDQMHTLTRQYLSDINDIEASFYLLFYGKYKFTAGFSCALALYFDLVSLAVGIFVYYLSKKERNPK